VHIGCSDLLVDMGMPGAFGCPEIMAAIQRVIAAARANGIHAGLGGDKDPARQAQLIRDGIRFVTTPADIALLMEGAAARTAAIREAVRG